MTLAVSEPAMSHCGRTEAREGVVRRQCVWDGVHVGVEQVRVCMSKILACLWSVRRVPAPWVIVDVSVSVDLPLFEMQVHPPIEAADRGKVTLAITCGSQVRDGRTRFVNYYFYLIEI